VFLRHREFLRVFDFRVTSPTWLSPPSGNRNGCPAQLIRAAAKGRVPTRDFLDVGAFGKGNRIGLPSPLLAAGGKYSLAAVGHRPSDIQLFGALYVAKTTPAGHANRRHGFPISEENCFAHVAEPKTKNLNRDRGAIRPYLSTRGGRGAWPLFLADIRFHEAALALARSRVPLGLDIIRRLISGAPPRTWMLVGPLESRISSGKSCGACRCARPHPLNRAN